MVRRNRPPSLPPRYEPLPELPENRALLAVLRLQATPPSGPGDFTIGAWQLHAHPDLQERMEALRPRHPVSCAYGMPVLAFEGVAAVVAWGQRLLVRLPVLPEGVETSAPAPPLTGGGGWHPVDAWPQRTGHAEGTARLTALVDGALLHARDLGRGRRRRN
ncbi:hypothetical protein ACFCX4_11270 [Kitasatospora sp. NPDC056327]|uniref:hypothetical protein n=1 Tax=Kitasatospora sp. NPDC056327 TaxID=3345785 RepID=UPI0035D57EF5